VVEGSHIKMAGRRAGLAYLILDVFSIAGYMTLTGLLAGSSSMVLTRLASNQTQLTLALLSSTIGFAAWVVLGVLLYKLMSPAGRISGLFMVIFVVAGTAMNLIALAKLLPLVSPVTSAWEWACGLFWLLQFALAFEPSLGQMVAFRVASVLTGIPGVVGGEFGICLWLSIKGARELGMDALPERA
jgi:hypothetical protein